MCHGQCGGELTCLPGTYGPHDPGGGPWIEHLGIRSWFRDPDLAPAAQPPGEIFASWSTILGAWPAVELDLQDWGIDVESGVLAERSWRWLATRLQGLVSTPGSRLCRTLAAARIEQEEVSDTDDAA